MCHRPQQFPCPHLRARRYWGPRHFRDPGLRHSPCSVAARSRHCRCARPWRLLRPGPPPVTPCSRRQRRRVAMARDKNTGSVKYFARWLVLYAYCLDCHDKSPESTPRPSRPHPRPPLFAPSPPRSRAPRPGSPAFAPGLPRSPRVCRVRPGSPTSACARPNLRPFPPPAVARLRPCAAPQPWASGSGVRLRSTSDDYRTFAYIAHFVWRSGIHVMKGAGSPALDTP
jgi:hypothetical protein